MIWTENRGRSIAIDVITSVRDWTFRELGLKEITERAFAKSIGSKKALMRAGSFLEATLQPRGFTEGNSRTDVLRFAQFAPGHETS